MLLWDVAEPQADALLGRQPPDVTGVQTNGATQQWQFADDRLHQGRLAGAVAAKDGDAAAPRYVHGDAEQNLASAIPGVEIADIEVIVVRHGGDRPPVPWRSTGSARPS